MSDPYIINDLDVTLTTEMLPQDRDVIVYADTVTLSPTVQRSGDNLTIFARIVVAGTATLDLSGATGQSQSGMAARGTDGASAGAAGGTGVAGLAGGSGNPGGDLTITAGQITGTLKVITNGGVGGAGQSGGRGGDGAIGADGRDCTQGGDGCSGWQDDPQPGEQGGQAGAGGVAGKYGDGGAAGNVVVMCQSGVPSIAATLVGGLAGTGSTVVGGSAGNPGQGGRGGLHMERDSPGGRWNVPQCWVSSDRTDSGSQGLPGTAGAGPASGIAGVGGAQTSPVTDQKTFQNTFPLTLALRTLHKAERSYFNGDYATTTAILTWLQWAAPIPTTGDEWTPLAQRVLTLQAQLQRGLTYYGKPSNAVPLADAGTYLGLLSPLLTEGVSVEADYFTFRDKNQTSEDRMTALKSRLSKNTDSVTDLTDQLTKAAAQQVVTNKAIQDLHDKIQTQYATLLSADDAFQNAVTKKANCDSIMESLQAMGSMISMGAGVMGDLSAMQSALGNLKDETNSFSVIMQQIVTAGKDIDSVQAAWNSLSDKAGDSSKIAMEKSDFDELMKPFLAMPEAKAYLDAVHAYLASIQARNQKILEYDALVVQQVQIQATIDQKNAEFTRVSGLLANEANQDPGLADYVAFMEGNYQDLQTLLLRYLAEANSALNYYTLSDTQLTVGKAGQDLSMGDISTAASTITTALPNFINNTSGPQEPFNGLAITLAAAPAGTYTDPAQDPFTQFLQGDFGVHQLTFSVPLGTLPGLYQVTGQTFKVDVTGCATPPMTRLIHSGYAPFQDAKLQTVEFGHAPVDVFFGPNGGGALSSKDYIGLSPCTAWLLSMREDENPGLVLTGITQIVVTFSGLAHLTAMNAVKTAEAGK